MNLALFGTNIEPKWEDKLTILLHTLYDKGANLCYYATLLKSLTERDISIPEGTSFSSSSDLPANTDLFLTLGGDGTFLNSLNFIRSSGIPIAGINFGRLGFLTASKVSDDENRWIDDLICSNYRIEKRPLLRIESPSILDDFYPYALNEVTIQCKSSYMISLDLKINDIEIPTYWADGLIIATPTGSTAYSLSVGGPIVAPGSGVFIIAPIASHNLNVRPVVIADNSRMEVSIHSKEETVIVTVDNRSFEMPSGSSIRLSKGEFPLNSVSLSDSSFFAALREKLLWGADKRNNI